MHVYMVFVLLRSECWRRGGYDCTSVGGLQVLIISSVAGFFAREISMKEEPITYAHFLPAEPLEDSSDNH